MCERPSLRENEKHTCWAVFIHSVPASGRSGARHGSYTASPVSTRAEIPGKPELLQGANSSPRPRANLRLPTSAPSPNHTLYSLLPPWWYLNATRSWITLETGLRSPCVRVTVSPFFFMQTHHLSLSCFLPAACVGHYYSPGHPLLMLPLLPPGHFSYCCPGRSRSAPSTPPTHCDSKSLSLTLESSQKLPRLLSDLVSHFVFITLS